MQNIGVRKLGGVASLLVAVFTALFLLLIVLTPQEAIGPGDISWMRIFSDYALALLGLAGLAAVPALTQRVSAESEGWMRWTSTLATIGFALIAVTSFWQAEYETSLSMDAYEAPYGGYDDDVAPIAEEGAAAPFDHVTLLWELLSRVPQGWLESAGVGLWVFSISWLAGLTGALPDGLVRVGLAAGVFSFCTSAGSAFQLVPLHALGVLINSLFLTPLWFARMGLLLLQEEGLAVHALAPRRAAWRAAARRGDRLARAPFTVGRMALARLLRAYR